VTDGLPTPAAFVFDWDNTLVDNWRSIHAALNATFDAMGHPRWSLVETKARVRASLRDSFPAMFGDRWLEARDIFYARFRADHLATLSAMPRAGEVLQQLAEDGYYLAVVSNKQGDLLRAEAARLGWDRRLGGIVGAGDAARDKPAPDPVDRALAPGPHRSGPAVWFVGDAAIDMACARAAGCTGILVGDSEPNPAAYADFPPAAKIDDLNSLAVLVRSLEGTIS